MKSCFACGTSGADVDWAKHGKTKGRKWSLCRACSKQYAMRKKMEQRKPVPPAPEHLTRTKFPVEATVGTRRVFVDRVNGELVIYAA